MSNGFSQSKPYAKHHGFWAAGLSAVSPRLGTAVGVSAVLCSEAVHAGDTQSMAEIGDENLGLRQADRWESNLYTYTYIYIYILVGGLEHVLFSIIYGIILPN